MTTGCIRLTYITVSMNIYIYYKCMDVIEVGDVRPEVVDEGRLTIICLLYTLWGGRSEVVDNGELQLYACYSMPG